MLHQQQVSSGDRPWLMLVDSDDFGTARAYVDELSISITADATMVREQVAREVAARLGVPVSTLRFTVRESFDGGPRHQTHSWRYQPPRTWEQIVYSLQESYAASVA